jgi:hypothetical protein
MKRLSALVAIAAATLSATPSQADVTTKQFLQLYFSPDGEDLGALRIAAMEQGIHSLNDHIAATGGKADYCQPASLVLTASQLADMVKRATEKDSKLEDQPLSVTLIGVLESTFPCTAAK